MAGYKSIGAGAVAALWVNGGEQTVNGADYNSTLTAVAVNNDDVYYAGFTSKGATYWKNASPVIIGPTIYSRINAIAFSGNDVYFGGYNAPNATKYPEAVYWKNDKIVELTDGTVDTEIVDIAVSGTDVFAVGHSVLQSNFLNHSIFNGSATALYWKNGVLIPLEGVSTAGYYGSYTTAIALSGSDVYITGSLNNIPGYWKNGVFSPLNHGTKYQNSRAIAIKFDNNNDMYIAGADEYLACNWKNGILHSFYTTPYHNSYSSVASMAIDGNDVYYGGNIDNTAAYWLNDKAMSLPALNATTSGVSSVFIHKHQ